MAMSPRLLRPILSGDPDARRYIAAVQQADQQSLEPAVRKAINDFVVGCKQDGIWSAIKASCILAGARTLSGALVPLVGPAPSNTNFVAGDYNRATGLKGNLSNKSLNTNRNGNADGQDDKHAAVYATEATTAATGFRVYYGITPGGGNDHVLERPSTAATTLTSRFHSSTNDSVSGAGNATGFLGTSRSSAADYILRHSGSNNTITRASAAQSANPYFIFTNNTAFSTLYSDARIAFYSIGSAIDLALLDARVSALVTAIGAS